MTKYYCDLCGREVQSVEKYVLPVLKDKDYFVIEPCVSCEKHYIEDIWWEDCCDMKRCIHAEEYKKAKETDTDDN